MTWSPASLHIQAVNVQKPTPPGAVVDFTLIGGGFAKTVDVFFVHQSVNAEQFLTAMMQGGGSKTTGVVQGTKPSGSARQINCSADMRKTKGGKYDAFVVQIVGGKLQTAAKAGAFNWRRR